MVETAPNVHRGSYCNSCLQLPDHTDTCWNGRLARNEERPRVRKPAALGAVTECNLAQASLAEPNGILYRVIAAVAIVANVTEISCIRRTKRGAQCMRSHFLLSPRMFAA